MLLHAYMHVRLCECAVCTAGHDRHTTGDCIPCDCVYVSGASLAVAEL